MAIIELQRSIQEAGRIRIGQVVPASGGKTRPSKLETFRFTSSDKLRIEQIAGEYGGDVAEWESPNGKQWQVISKADAIDVLVPPADLSFSQWYELWSAGGCQRRCNGATEQISGSDCVCDPAARECDIHTRLSVLLRAIPGLGVWRLDSQGYYAAVELNGALQLINMAIGAGKLLPARLRLEQRSVKRPGANGRPTTYRFAVPLLDLEVTPDLLLAGGAPTASLEQAARPLLDPVPEGEPTPSIAAQSAPPTQRPRRAGSGPEVPATGRTRAAAAQPPPAPAPDEEAPTPTRPRAAQGTAAPVRPRRTADPAPTEEPPPAAAPAFDRQHWQSRIHAAASERGIDHTGLRLIAAAECSVDPAEVDAFSSNDLVEDEFRAIDSHLRGLPEAIKGTDATADLDALSQWVWPRANAKGLDSWDAIDAVAVAATGKQPDELTLAEWVAFTVRLIHGAYDANQAAS